MEGPALLPSCNYYVKLKLAHACYVYRFEYTHQTTGYVKERMFCRKLENISIIYREFCHDFIVKIS
jgi:hypothetical protein